MLISTTEVLFLHTMTVFVNCHDINQTELSASNILKLKKVNNIHHVQFLTTATALTWPEWMKHSLNNENESIFTVFIKVVLFYDQPTVAHLCLKKKKLSLQLLLSFTIRRKVLGHLRITSKVVIIHALTQGTKWPWFFEGDKTCRK